MTKKYDTMMSPEEAAEIKAKLDAERESALAHLRELAAKGDIGAEAYAKWLARTNVEEEMFKALTSGDMSGGEVIYGMIRQFTTNISFLLQHSKDPDSLRMSLIPQIFKGLGIGVIMGSAAMGDDDDDGGMPFRFPPTSGKPN